MQRRGYVVVYRHSGGSHKWLQHEETGAKVGICYHNLSEPIHRRLITKKLDALGFPEDEMQDILTELFE